MQIYCDTFYLLIAYTLYKTMTSQNHQNINSSKETANVIDSLSKIENNLMTSINVLKGEIINLIKIIIKKFMLANKVAKWKIK